MDTLTFAQMHKSQSLLTKFLGRSTANFDNDLTTDLVEPAPANEP